MDATTINIFSILHPNLSFVLCLLSDAMCGCVWLGEQQLIERNS